MQANVLKQNMTGGISCILLLLFSFLVVPTGDVKGIEPCPTYLSDGSRPCYYCGVVEIGNPSLIVVDGGYLFIAEDSIASNIHNYNDLFKTDGCFVLAEDYVEMEMFLSESEFEEADELMKYTNQIRRDIYYVSDNGTGLTAYVWTSKNDEALIFPDGGYVFYWTSTPYNATEAFSYSPCGTSWGGILIDNKNRDRHYIKPVMVK